MKNRLAVVDSQKGPIKFKQTLHISNRALQMEKNWQKYTIDIKPWRWIAIQDKSSDENNTVCLLVYDSDTILP